MRRTCVLLAVMMVLLHGSPAFADLTAFVGATTDPATRTTRGLALGMGLIIVGFEFEYADAGGDDEDDPGCSTIAPPGSSECKPSLRTGMANVLLQMPRGITPFQLYGTIGGGVYHQHSNRGDVSDTGFGSNVGGGVKIDLIGPLRLRLDYRIFKLSGADFSDNPHRFYAGANLAF